MRIREARRGLSRSLIYGEGRTETQSLVGEVGFLVWGGYEEADLGFGFSFVSFLFLLEEA